MIFFLLVHPGKLNAGFPNNGGLVQMIFFFKQVIFVGAIY